LQLKSLSALEKRLIVAIVVCAVLLVVIYQWFLKVKEEAENPAPAHVRQNSLLLNKQKGAESEDNDIVESPDEDPIQIFEKTKKTQRGLGNMLREDIKLPEEKPRVPHGEAPVNAVTVPASTHGAAKSGSATDSQSDVSVKSEKQK